MQAVDEAQRRLAAMFTPQVVLSSPVLPDLSRLEAVTKEVDNFLDRMRVVLESPAVVLAEADRTLLGYTDRAHKLGQAGWTLPLLLPMQGLLRLLDRFDQVVDLDRLFEDLYTEDDSALARELTSALVTSDGLAHWQPLIDECVINYFEKRYLITIPSLLAVIEGALWLAYGSLTNTETDPRRAVQGRLDNSDRAFQLLICESLRGFLDSVFQGRGFNSSRPAMLNRHWILHGRDAPGWSRADSLRLLQAIHTCLPDLTRTVARQAG